MTDAEPGLAPVGVRPAPDGAGGGPGRIRWVRAGSFSLTYGDRVAVREDGALWLGEVVVPPDRLVEWPALADLPSVTRRVVAAEWPGTRATDGCRLLESLDLPPDLLGPP